MYTLEIECLSLLFIIPSEVIFSASDNHIITKLETPKTSFVLVLLYSQNYAAGIRRHFHEYSDGFEHPQKSFLNQATNINTCQIFLQKKKTGIENFKPQNILRSSPSLEIQSTPTGKPKLLWPLPTFQL